MPFFPDDLVWRISSWSGGANCVEVAKNKTTVLVRDTKNRAQGILSFSPAAWEDFLKEVQAANGTSK
jgi:Domain of unknown function (DUF397)